VLERDGECISTVDLCGGRWMLLTGAQGTAWAEAAWHATRRLDLALSVQLIGMTPGWVDVAGRWDAAYGVGATGAALVRPDGFVAWRSSGRVTNPQALLEQALARVLGKA
jgi:tetracenomycin A2 monooxygenase-dioxygenase